MKKKEDNQQDIDIALLVQQQRVIIDRLNSLDKKMNDFIEFIWKQNVVNENQNSKIQALKEEYEPFKKIGFAILMLIISAVVGTILSLILKQ